VLIYWRRRTVFFLIPAAGIITALALFFYTKALWLSNSFSTGTLIGRINLWIKTISMLNNWHAFFGIGLGNWAEAFNNLYKVKEIHMHNNYIQIYTDMGIFGFLAISLAIVIFTITAIKIMKSLKNNIQKGLAIGLIGSFLGGAFFNMLDVTMTGTVIGNGSYIYLSIPLLWIWAGFYSVIYHKLFPDERSELSKL
jgi:O-antigen ligase